MDEETSTYVVWTDNTLLLLGGFILMAMLLLSVINPPKPEDAKDIIIGEMRVEMAWADNVDSDIDLWVQAPNEKPVGYSAKNQKTFNLLRDDLGMTSDAMPINYEVAITRGLPTGEYVVNVHFYSDRTRSSPIEVTIQVSIQPSPERPVTKFSKKIILRKVGDEITVFRFHLDSRMNIVTGSMNDIQKNIRAAKP